MKPESSFRANRMKLCVFTAESKLPVGPEVTDC